MTASSTFLLLIAGLCEVAKAHNHKPVDLVGCGRLQERLYPPAPFEKYAETNDHPWMALLVHKGGDVCSGLLIPTSKRNSSFAVVTSSGCQSKGDIGEWVVLTGIGPNGQIDGPYSRVSKPTTSLVVTNDTQEEDVAFVFFYPEVPFNEHVIPVCLPSRSKPPSRSQCILTGYEVERSHTGNNSYNVLIEGVSRARLREMAFRASSPTVRSSGKIRRLQLKDKSDKTGLVHSLGSPLVCNHGGLWALYGTYIPSLSGVKEAVFTDFFDALSLIRAILLLPQLFDK
ncbi:hypothetical protein M513_01546 [Trichuris suis]|uniref:Peptidase S1 domain-containing protein n=1 Tax=Trichuris suis TaxID=68888 RepID=A0A085MJP7_9BILA|nr:hypothetical protein M513_01546 [Trichuris suis]